MARGEQEEQEEQEEQLAAFNDDELEFDGKRGSATIIGNDETPKSEKKPLVRMWLLY